MEISIKDFYWAKRKEVLGEMVDAMKMDIRSGNNPDYNRALESACRALNRVSKFIK